MTPGIPTLGWMVTGTAANGSTKALPISPAVLNEMPARLHVTLPTMGGVWNDEADATKAFDALPPELKPYFEVTPVMVTPVKRGL